MMAGRREPVAGGRGGRRGRHGAGSSLVELVVVIAITAILAGGMTAFLTAPFQAFRDLGRRARLVDEAESALRRMARDVRRALPNSLRVAAGGTTLEFLHAADGVKYRRHPGTNPGPQDHGAGSDWLGFGAGGDASWNALGRFTALSFSYGTPLPAGTRLAVHPTGSVVYADAASGANPGLVTPASTGITLVDDGDEDQIQLSAPFRFRFESPEQRLYVLDGPITYRCDVAAGTLLRFGSYPIGALQPTDPSAPPLSAAASARVAHRVAACRFLYQAGTSQRQALLTLELTLAEAGEQIALLHQIQVENAP